MIVVSRKDPTNLLYVRMFFGVTILTAAVLRALVYFKMQGVVDERRVHIKATKQMGVEVEAKEMSVSEFDDEKMTEAIRQLMMAALLTTAIHHYSAAIFPLIFGGISQIMMAFESELFQIHVLGYSDSGAGNPLKRPWSAPKTGFDDLWKKANEMSDPAGTRKTKSSKKQK